MRSGGAGRARDRAAPARAVEAINVRTDAQAIDLTDAAERHRTEADRLLVSAAPGPDGIVRRMDVRAREGNTNWAVFALANSGDEQIERLIVVPHYRMVGSGVFWPDLGRSRVASITSSGERPDRQDSATADIFRITLDPGSVMTYVLELRGDKLNQLYLWQPEAYKDKVNSITLYHGIVIGIAGLLALFLTILFVVKGSVMFPAAAALAWAVLVYIGIDFGFWGKVFALSPDPEQIWRAASEAILAATLVVFLFAYLNLNRWHVRYAHTSRSSGWHFSARWWRWPCTSPDRLRHRAGLALRCRPAGLRPRRLSVVPRLRPRRSADTDLAAAGGVGHRGGVRRHGGHHQRHRRAGAARRPRADRDADRLHGDAARLRRRRDQRHRLRRRAPSARAHRRRRHDLGLGRLADKVFTSPETEALLGLKRGALEGPAARWLDVLHPLDRDRFRAVLDSVLEQRRGRLSQDFRLRTPDGHYLWFAFKARPWWARTAR